MAGFGALVLIQSLAAFGYIESRLRSVTEKAEGKVAAEAGRLERLVIAEREERRREYDRIGRAMEAFTVTTGEMGKVAISVEHLAEGLKAHAALTDRNIDEVKHSIRNLDQKMTALAGV